MKVVLDTNVLFQAIYNKNGASGYILEKIRTKEIERMISIPVFIEYQDIFNRDKTKKLLKIDSKGVNIILDFISAFSTPVEIKYLMRPNLQDEGDNMFVDLAFASRSNFLITSNTKDYLIENDLKFDSFRVINPSEFVVHWRKNYE